MEKLLPIQPSQAQLEDRLTERKAMLGSEESSKVVAEHNYDKYLDEEKMTAKLLLREVITSPLSSQDLELKNLRFVSISAGGSRMIRVVNRETGVILETITEPQYLALRAKLQDQTGMITNLYG